MNDDYDYDYVKVLSERFYDMLEDVSEVRIETSSSTDLTLKVDQEFFKKDTGFLNIDGDFGNLPFRLG